MKITIGQRILLGFGFIIALTIGLSLFQRDRMAGLQSYVEGIVNRDVVLSQLVNAFQRDQLEMRALREQALVAALYRTATGERSGDPQSLQRKWRDAREETQASINELRELADARADAGNMGGRREVWADILAQTDILDRRLAEIADEVESEFALVNAGDFSALDERDQRLEALRDSFAASAAEVDGLLTEALAAGKASVDRLEAETTTYTYAALAATVLIAFVAALLIMRSITGPLSGVVRVVERMGKGDLTGKVEVVREDELGQLSGAINAAIETLKEFTTQSKSVAEELNGAAAETLASTQQQTASAEQQYAAIQETTATLDEITQSGSQISQRAKDLSAAGETTTSSTQAGLQAVRGTIEAMDAIREQAEDLAENIVGLSEKTQTIGQIITKVNDIAERSHMLALNAAIEAAAAGESGRSFSVLADELKVLAEQAKGATGDVRSMLSDIQQGINTSVMLTEEAVKRVGRGKETTDASQEAIEALRRSVQESVNAFEQIAAATNQQQIGLEQASRALQSIREASEQSTAGTSQLQQAAANLNVLGEQLVGSVRRYQM